MSIVFDSVSAGTKRGVNVVLEVLGLYGRKVGAAVGEKMVGFELTSLVGAFDWILGGGTGSTIGMVFSSPTAGCFFRKENGKAATSLAECANVSKMKDVVSKFFNAFCPYSYLTLNH